MNPHFLPNAPLSTVAFAARVYLACYVAWWLFGATAAIANLRKNGWRALVLFCSAILMLFLPGIKNSLLLGAFFRPYKLDAYILWLDGSLGFQPSFLVARFFSSHPWLTTIEALVYMLMPHAILAVLAVYLWRASKTETWRMLRVALLNLVGAVPFYWLFPVCGPGYAFAGFPHTMPSHLQEVLSVAQLPNAIPSLHFSSALLIARFLWPWTGLRWFGIAFVVATAAATLGLGEHYAFDLVVAVPYTLGVYWLGARQWLSRSANAPSASDRRRHRVLLPAGPA
jgi:hypothetical protein